MLIKVKAREEVEDRVEGPQPFSHAFRTASKQCADFPTRPKAQTKYKEELADWPAGPSKAQLLRRAAPALPSRPWQRLMEHKDASVLLEGAPQQAQATSNTQGDGFTDEGGAMEESEAKRKVLQPARYCVAAAVPGEPALSAE